MYNTITEGNISYDRAFRLLYLLAKGKRLLVLIIKIKFTCMKNKIGSGKEKYGFYQPF